MEQADELAAAGTWRKSLLNEPVFTELGKKYGKTPAQVILRWHSQMGSLQ